MDYFRNYAWLRDSYKQHNEALKYFRLEDPIRPQASHQIPHMNDADHIIPQIVHDPVGQKWTCDLNKLVPWNWKELVAQMDDASMEFFVKRP